MSRSLLALLALAATTVAAVACPFCSTQGQTLSGEIATADLIVLGTLTNAKPDPADITKGTTDLVIESVIKPHGYLAGKKVLVIPRYLPDAARAGDTKFLVYGAVYTKPADLTAAGLTGGWLLTRPETVVFDPYRGVPMRSDSALPLYLQGAIAVREKDTPARLRYFFDYLENPDLEISTDAMMEFGNTEYKDVRALAEKLPGEKVLKWLQDPNTPPSRYGLYGLMVGHCAKKEDAVKLRALLDDPARAKSSGVDGLMAGLILLDPKLGWDHLTALIKDPNQEFATHYACLRTLRFFWEFRPDVIGKDKVLAGMRDLVALKDLADLPIEDLRKWGCWDQTDYVLGFAAKESHNKTPIIRRAILRFALSAPASHAAAKQYVEQARKEDPERVKFVEQTLADDKPLTPPAAGK
ncbi:MAG: hypothetical protein U0871_11850 [Gemmataceae bacterium]